MRAKQWPTTAVLVGLVVLGLAGVVSVAACEPDRAGGDDAASVAGAGGGLEDLTPEQVLEKARQAGAELTSLRGTIRQQRKAGTLEYSLSVTRDGDCTGTVSEDGVEAEVRRHGGTVWVKPSASMFQAALPDAGPALADKWLTGTGELGKSYAGYCDLVFRLATGDGPLKAVGEWTKTGVRPVSGTRAVFLGFRSGEGGPHGSSGTVAIAAEGQPYLLSANETGDSATAIRFDAFGKPVEVTPPSADETADASGHRIVLDGNR
ncbi:hypothetical protein ACFYS8_25685 [Kitasatospora sp. NPDC004615]|uniref:hypothetical protein n=1 Tax=Kitasatospora sp. NPDC004615 TaxID=3364017 RepID=UPI0036ABB7B7